jgi:hypothetical protein
MGDIPKSGWPKANIGPDGRVVVPLAPEPKPAAAPAVVEALVDLVKAIPLSNHVETTEDAASEERAACAQLCNDADPGTDRSDLAARIRERSTKREG